jgi:imidazolonepropionase-like amidohydrolase
MMIPGFCVHDELVAMVRGGMTPLAALQTATVNPARYFGLRQTLGSVGPGQRADLVLLDAKLRVGLLERKELNKLLVQVKIAARRMLGAAVIGGRVEYDE